MKCIKRSIALLLTAVLLGTSTQTTVFSVEPDNQTAKQTQTQLTQGDVTINSTNVTLYGLDSTWEEYISIPSDYPQSFQIEVSGASKFSCEVISGHTVNVSSDGLITPNYTTWYQYDGWLTTAPPEEGVEVPFTRECIYRPSEIEVRAGGQSFIVTVDLVDYANVYADQFLDRFIAENIDDSMTDLEKVTFACRYFAENYDHSSKYYTTAAMILSGEGDCVANTSTLLKVYEKLGINAWWRDASKGTLTNHVNLMVEIDGKYYEVDAGYAGRAPRYYSVKERDSLYSYRHVSGGIEVYQYDAQTNPTSLAIPPMISGYTVVGLGEEFLEGEDNITTVIIPSTVQYINDAAFCSCPSLQKLRIPESVTQIGDFVFSACDALTSLTCDEDNPNYTVVDNVMYNKDMTKLLYAPSATELTIPESVEEIAKFALNYNRNLTHVTIPSSVTTIAQCAFQCCQNLAEITIPNSVETLEDGVFAGCYGLSRVTFLNTLDSIPEGTFYDCYKLTDIYYSGTVEEWSALEVGDHNNRLPYAIVHCSNGRTPYIPGDANANGEVDMRDAVMIQQYLNGWDVEIDENVADVNANGKIDMRDAVLIQQYLNGWDVELK